MEAIGVKMTEVAKDGTRSWRSMDSVMRDMMIKTASTTRDTEELTKAASGGKFQWAKLAATISDYSTFLDATKQSIMGTGSTMDYAAVQLETLSKKVEILKQHLVGLSVATGNNGLSSTLKSITDAAINLVSGFEHMDGSTIALVGSLTGLLLVIPKVAIVINELMAATKALTATQAVLTVLQGNLAGLLAGGVVAALGVYAISAGKAEEEQRKLNQAMEEAVKTAPQIADGYTRSASFIRETANDIQTIESEISKAQAEGNQERVEKLKEYLATAKRVISETAGYDLSKNLVNSNFSSKAIEEAAKALEEKGKITSLMVEAGRGEEVTITDLTEKYVGLRKEINSNTLDEESLIKKKIQLHDITEKLITLVPSLSDGFDKNGDSVLKFDGILNDNSKTIQDYIKIVKEYMAIDLEQRISKQQLALDASQKKMEDAKNYLAFLQNQSGVVKIYGKDTISRDDLKKATEEVSNATREYEKQQLALQGLKLQKDSLLTSTKALNNEESKKFIGAGDDGKIIAQGEQMISLTKEQTAQVKLLNKAELELYESGELSQKVLNDLVQKYPDVTNVIGESKEAIQSWIKSHRQMAVETINNEKKKTLELIQQTKKRIELMKEELKALTLVAEGRANETKDKTQMTPEEAMRRAAALRNETAESKKTLENLNGVLTTLDKMGDSVLRNTDLEKKQASDAEKAARDREKAIKERERIEREAAKAAEEARRREIEQLKEAEAHYQKMYELKKRLHDLSMETEEYAYSKMKKDSQEARDQLQKMINLRKEGMASDATEAKRLEESAVSFEKAAQNEASIAAQNKYGLSPTDTSNTFSGPHASLVNKYAIANGVNPILSGAVMMQESGGKGNNVMQVNGMNGASVEATIKKGNEILGKLLVKTNGNIEKALAAYNMGEGILKFFDENGGYSRENMKKFSDMQKKKYGYKIYGDPDYIQHVFNRLPDTVKPTTKPPTATNKGVNTSGNASDFVKLKSDYVKGPTNINPYLLSLLETLAKDKGKTISLTSGGRTKAQQEDLKRRKPGLAAQAGYSKHEYGLAVDVADQWLKNMSEAELAKYGLHKPALKSKGEDWHIEPIQTKGVRNPTDIKKLSITLATEGGTSVTEVPIDFSKELQGQADDNHSKALELKSRQISEQQLIDEAEQRKVESWLLYYDNEISKIEQRIKDSEIKMKTLDPTSPGYRKELQNQVQLRKDKQDLFHQSAEYIRSVEAKAKKNKDLYSGDFLEEIKKIKEQRGQAWKEVFGEINSISYEIVRNELAELSEKTDQYDRQLNISRTTIGLFKEDSAEYRQELEKQADILNQKINIEKETQRIIEERLRTEGLLAHQIEELNKQKDESIRREREYQVEIKRTRQTLYDQVADNLSKIKEARIKQLEKQRDDETDRIQKQIEETNEGYERRIELKQKELNQLDEQYDKEERLKRLRDIDDEIAKVKADKRFSYITAEGKEILTYNKERVSELELQRNELLQQYQREDVRKARQQEIEDLRREKDEKEKVLREQLENVKRNYDQQIETEKQKWDQIIESAKNGTLGYNDIMNGENGFFPTAIADLQKFGVDVQKQIDQIKAAYESLNNIRVSLPSLGGFGGGGGGGGGSDRRVYDENGRMRTPGESGYDNSRIGSDGMTDYVREAYREAKENGGKVLTRHSGGFVDGKQPSRLAELANKLFNTKPSEQMVKALKGELFVPEHNILNNFIPNMQNLVNSISVPSAQPIPVGGDKYYVTVEKVVANNPMEFLKNVHNYVRATQK